MCCCQTSTGTRCLGYNSRKGIYAKCAEFVFGVHDGNVDQKAKAFIQHVRHFIQQLGMAENVSKWEGATIKDGDVDKVTHEVFIQSTGTGDKAFGLDYCVTTHLVHL